MNEMKRSVSWKWMARDGSENSVSYDLPDLTPATLAIARNCAEQAGYPGHRGRWWNYLIDDIRGLFA